MSVSQRDIWEFLGGEEGDASSQLNVYQDLAGTAFDPAAGLLAQNTGFNEGFDWDQLFQFEYDVPEPTPITVGRPYYESGVNSGDPIMTEIANIISAGGSPMNVRQVIVDAIDGGEESPLLKDYMNYAENVFKENTEYQAEAKRYEQELEKFQAAEPKLVETDMVKKFRKAGIPLPTERPEYVASDFNPGQTERELERDISGRQAGDARREQQRLRREKPFGGAARASDVQGDIMSRILERIRPRDGGSYTQSMGGKEYEIPGRDTGAAGAARVLDFASRVQGAANPRRASQGMDDALRQAISANTRNVQQAAKNTDWWAVRNANAQAARANARGNPTSDAINARIAQAMGIWA